jgi:hypothetical protein
MMFGAPNFLIVMTGFDPAIQVPMRRRGGRGGMIRRSAFSVPPREFILLLDGHKAMTDK